MADIRDTLILDIDAALRQVQELENALNRALSDLVIDVNVGPGVAQLDDDLSQAAVAADDIADDAARMDRELSDAATSTAELEDELRDVERAADRAADETKRIDDEASAAATSFGRVGRTLGTLAVAAGAAVGLREITQFLQGAVAAAVDTSESINAVEVVFGEAAETVLAFGEDTSDSVFLVASSFNELAAVTGTLLQGFGLGVQEAADITIVLTERASDLASVFNTEVSVALEAINAALRGETEQIRRFTGSFSIEEVTRFGRELFNVEGALTSQQQALAAVEFLLQKTAAVQGDAANTADELANRQRALNEVWGNAQGVIGQQLVPALEELIPLLIGAAEATGRSTPAFVQNVKDLGSAVADFGGIFVNLGQALVAVPLDDLTFSDFRSQFEDAADSSARLIKGVGGVDSILRDFIPLLSDGEDNTLDFANALFTLADQNELTAARFDEFASAAAAGGVGIQDQALALRTLIQSGQVAGPQLSLIVGEFVGLLAVLEDIGQIGGVSAVISADDLAGIGSTFGTFGGDIQGILLALAEDQEISEEAALALAIALDTEADAFRESAFAGAAAFKAQKEFLGVTDEVIASVNGARQAIIDLAREQAASADPVINLIRRTEDHEQALADLADVEAAGVERSDELDEARLRVVETGGQLQVAEATVLSALDETTEGFITQAIAAGLTADAVDELIASLDRLRSTPVPTIGVGGLGSADFDLRNAVGAAATLPPGGTTTQVAQTPNVVIETNIIGASDPDIVGAAAQAGNVVAGVSGLTTAFIGG